MGTLTRGTHRTCCPSTVVIPAQPGVSARAAGARTPAPQRGHRGPTPAGPAKAELRSARSATGATVSWPTVPGPSAVAQHWGSPPAHMDPKTRTQEPSTAGWPAVLLQLGTRGDRQDSSPRGRQLPQHSSPHTVWGEARAGGTGTPEQGSSHAASQGE